MEIGCKFGANKEGKYICCVNPAQIIKPNTKIEAFVGTHSQGKSNEDVEGIFFKGAIVKYFPRNMTQHFPNLEKVAICRCGLKQVTKQDLVGLEHLTTLWLEDNELETLQPDLLRNMRQLNSISFCGNKLKFVASQTFKRIKDQLNYLNLCANSNIDASFGTGAGSVNTIEELMKLINENCAQPKFQHEVDREKAHSAFRKLWTSRRFSDFNIVVGKKWMKVHKNVLGTQSPVFAEMFETDMEESKSGQMTIIDFRASSVEEFLKFFYTGEVPDATNAFEVFALAAKYGVGSLKRAMERIIGDNIDSENAIEVLKLGNLHSSEVLISKAFNEVKLANPVLELADKMKNEPKNIKKLIAAKNQLLLEVAEARNRFHNLKRKFNGI